MKIFFLFLLTILVVTAAPHEQSNKCILQHVLLKEIIDDTDTLIGKKLNQGSQILVENVIRSGHCTHENFCRAGIVLSGNIKERLGVNGTDWLLPRKLVAYSRNTHCNVRPSDEQTDVLQLLQNIRLCAQKENQKKTCD